jgi:hypothetical protein
MVFDDNGSEVRLLAVYRVTQLSRNVASVWAKLQDDDP